VSSRTIKKEKKKRKKLTLHEFNGKLYKIILKETKEDAEG